MTHEQEQQAMPAAFKWVVAGTLLAVVGLVGSLAAMAVSQGAPVHAASAQPPSRSQTASMKPLEEFKDVRIPDFAGTTQEGKDFNASALDGQVTVMDFFFTHCPLVCPEMTTRMMEQTKALLGTDVRFLSISVDPEHDTPEQMQTFSARYDADPSRWSFVRTSPDTLAEVSSAIGFGVRTNAASDIPLPDGTTMPNIIHPTSMLLVGPDRRIYGRYFYRDPDDLAKLSVEAEKLLNQR